MTELDPKTTALVLIDLQKGIAGPHTQPRDGDSVVAAAKALADRFRKAGAPVVLVHVGWSADGGDLPSTRADEPLGFEPGRMPAGWSDLVDGLEQPGDIRILKRQWGAFTGTGLDLQLRRRGIETLVIAGIATNFGVESTARHGWELGYDIVVAEDACASRSEELHHFAIANILPKLARIRTSDDLRLGDA
ncbi:hydrolase [Stakelama saccharophila]|uniref:Hydrolase n=1 Tax=Stakelama saccharophila TaxID=3075605 RepID=A0ABZ0B8D9_9SPHN|nr:hydrolase [Stakelama sp. W311]WNO53123.1 hydrolase [Stakelama sp. W311]